MYPFNFTDLQAPKPEHLLLRDVHPDLQNPGG